MQPLPSRFQTEKKKNNPYSGLTMNITGAALPTVPCLISRPTVQVQPEGLSSFVGQNEGPSKPPGLPVPPLTCASGQNPSAPPLPPPPITALPARAGNRARYVLASGTETTQLDSTTTFTSPSAMELPHAGTYPDMTQTEDTSLPFDSEQLPPTNLPTVVSDTYSPGFYEPADPVWFYATQVNGAKIWWSFSRHDSYKLEKAVTQASDPSVGESDPIAPETSKQSANVVSVEGGRYDVLVEQRERKAIYWDEPTTEIRRATWFYRLSSENRVLPFSEHVGSLLEAQYKLTMEQNLWGQRLEVPSEDERGGTDYFIFHNTNSMIQYRAWPHSCNARPTTEATEATSVETSGNRASLDETTSKWIMHATDTDDRMCHVRRGLDPQLLNQLDDGEFRPIEHLVFVVHGIGTVYNLKGQGLIECVDGLRRTSRTIAQSHFSSQTGRAEFLPITWHEALHSDATGVDDQLNQITLRSIPKLRQFTNGTLMDILFYTSSKYCQVIVDTVSKEICRLRTLFMSRNPDYKGGFSIVGHSLGSVIVFDLLAHQRPDNHHPKNNKSGQSTGGASSENGDEEVDFTCVPLQADRLSAKRGLLDQPGTEKSEQSSTSDGAVETEDWSLVGNQDSHKRGIEVVGPEDGVTDEQPHGDHRASGDGQKLADLLVQVGMQDGDIKKVVDAWMCQSNKLTDTTDSVGSQTSPLPPHGIETRSSLFTGFGMPVVNYPQLGFPVTALFMLGSPLPLFLTARGVRQLPRDYHLPTCPKFYNIFHPFDPVAYRVETIVEPMFQSRAVLMPHHKGRKRLHLQLRDNLARVGSDLKTKFYQSVNSTWRAIQGFAASHRILNNQTGFYNRDESDSNLAASNMGEEAECADEDDFESSDSGKETAFESQLNQGRRIDFVLQEAPFESFSDYLFALSSHAVYWESEDTSLFLLSDIYSSKPETQPTPNPLPTLEYVPGMASGIEVTKLEPEPTQLHGYPKSAYSHQDPAGLSLPAHQPALYGADEVNLTGPTFPSPLPPPPPPLPPAQVETTESMFSLQTEHPMFPPNLSQAAPMVTSRPAAFRHNKAKVGPPNQPVPCIGLFPPSSLPPEYSNLPSTAIPNALQGLPYTGVVDFARPTGPTPLGATPPLLPHYPSHLVQNVPPPAFSSQFHTPLPPFPPPAPPRTS